MTIQEILNESFYIEMSLSNLGIYNEGIGDVASSVYNAVVRMIEKFIGWVRNTVIPFFQRIGKIIANLLRKTKLGRKLLKKHDDKVAAAKATEEKIQAEQEYDNKDAEMMNNLKIKVMQYPTWLNYIANSLINPNAILKLANSTEDRSADINDLEEKISKHIEDGHEVKIIVGFDNAKPEVIKQLEIMEKSVQTFESNSKAIITRCEELKRKLEGKQDNGSVMRAKNTSAVIQVITQKTAESVKLSAEIIKKLKFASDPF